jgi:hypothetical protein
LWLQTFREAALASYETSKQIQDPVRRADSFRRLVDRRLGQGISQQALEQGVDRSAESKSSLTWTPPAEIEKTPRSTRPPSRSKLRRRAAEELARSPEYQAWQVARTRGLMVTEIGSGKFMEFWGPFIKAVQARLAQILTAIPVRGPILGFLPA